MGGSNKSMIRNRMACAPRPRKCMNQNLSREINARNESSHHTGPSSTTPSDCNQPIHPSTAIVNTGSTAHFSNHSTPVVNKRPTSIAIAITNPNGKIMYSTHEAKLNLPSFSLLHATSISYPP
mmetsp:Transcript_15467/g.22410  ORF Transcript_15467/g.22410 Transcript_15467/m.22410 type:complete len:123 (-) Transcript_15467:70-438(-)